MIPRCLGITYPVLAIVSNSYPSLIARLLMYYSPVRHSFDSASTISSVRLACIRHAASVHPEPGSNSPFDLLFIFCHRWLLFPLFCFFLTLCLYNSYSVFKDQILACCSFERLSIILYLFTLVKIFYLLFLFYSLRFLFFSTALLVYQIYFSMSIFFSLLLCFSSFFSLCFLYLFPLPFLFFSLIIFFNFIFIFFSYFLTFD